MSIMVLGLRAIMRPETHNLQKTVKHGIILYIVLAMLVLPSGICSQQHHLPDFPALALSYEPSDEQQNISDIETLEMEFQYKLFSQQDLLNDLPVDGTANQSEPVNPEPVQGDLPPYHDYIAQASETYLVDAALIRAIIQAESSCNPKAVSKRGAQGLMQLMPTTARAMGIEDSFDPALNIDGGVRYFKQLLDRFHGDVALALAAYNAGSRYVRKYKGVPPFKATRIYIKKVLQYRDQFAEEMELVNSTDSQV
jgi:hypothetical protein